MTPILHPQPREITVHEGTFYLPVNGYIQIPTHEDLFTAQWLQSALTDMGDDYDIVIFNTDDLLGVHLRASDAFGQQGYRLMINNAGVLIEGHGAGLFYGAITLQQLLMQYGRELPHLTITDSPDFPARGVMLDISRDKVPTMDTLYALIDDLAMMKINQLQLYIEHTFAYIGHEKVWKLASPMTGEEIMLLDAYCRERFIDLVPNQNSLGHMERWLKHPDYLPLAEKPDGFVPFFGGPHRSASPLDPQDPKSFELIQDLYDQFLPHFSSKLFNVGCDEPWELGQGKSKDAVEERGGRVYLDWMLKLYEDVSARGYQMMFWGDIIKNHPSLVPALPEDVIVMEWGYEAWDDFDKPCGVLAESNIPFYVCPGTSSWNTLIGRTSNAMENLRNAAEKGLKHGAIGYLITDWGDNGHHQPLPVSYLGFAYGGAVSWHYENNHDIDIASALSHFIFRDVTGTMGQLAYDFGEAHKILEWNNFNGHILAYLTQVPHMCDDFKNDDTERGDAFKAQLAEVIDTLDTLQARLHKTDMQRSDATLIIDEYVQASNLMKHAVKWVRFVKDIQGDSAYDLALELDSLMAQQRIVWLERNRRGGLEDSIVNLGLMRANYE